MTLALLLTAATGAWAQEVEQSESFTTNHEVSVYTGEHFKITVGDKGSGKGFYLAENKYATIEALNGEIITKVEFTKGYYYINNFYCEVGTTNISGDVATVSGVNNTSLTFTASGALQIKAVKVYFFTEPDVEVTTNAAEEGATFTEASFAMPAFDATAEYELVRDMSIQMTATMGDGTDGVRYRVKKAQQGEGYEPADLSMMQVLALVAVNDGIEQKALTLDQDYFCRIYKLDEQTLQPTGDGVKLNDFDFAPGLYALKAFAKDGSDYDGETALSNTFKLFQGYEVQVAAKEFITYYKDEALYVEDEAAELYTITKVADNKVELSNKRDVIPANYAMLVYNNSDEDKTILLIPAEQNPLAFMGYGGFIGTLVATTIPASTETTTNYAMNGKAFVYVKNAIEIGANKAWLQIPSQQQSAHKLEIVFDGNMTGVDTLNMKRGTVNDDSWYTVDGRKLQNKPTKKGVYILNGRKVVVK